MSTFLTQNLDIILRLMVAVVLGMVVGAERVWVHKEAGMKTHALVSLGAAMFVIISEILASRYAGIAGFDPSRIASQVVVGIGFLGAGAIILQGNRLLGLTTAGGLWVMAGIGMAAGFGFYSLAFIATILVLFILLIVYFFEKPIRKISGGDSADA
ncbi:MAG: MgtC/SapB family protein [Patescibacteria group bacterium]